MNLPAGWLGEKTRDWFINSDAQRRRVRSLGDRPVNVLDRDLKAMTTLPPAPPSTGFSFQIRLSRDYYLRFGTNDYSVDPRFIGRLVQLTATLERVVVVCDGQIAADHARCWAKAQVVTDPAHVATAKMLRAEFNQIRRRPTGRHAEVASRSLSVYDELFGLTPTSSTPSPAVGKEAA